LPTTPGRGRGVGERGAMDSKHEVTEWIAHLRSSDVEVRETAAERIWHHYINQLRAHVHTKISPTLRQRFDESDVLQSVFQSFFRRSYPELTSRDSLWALLLDITFKRLCNAANRGMAQRRDIRREVHQHEDENGVRSDLGRGVADVNHSTITRTYKVLVGNVPSEREADSFFGDSLPRLLIYDAAPDEAAIAADTFEHLLQILPDDILRQVVLLKLESYSDAEIANRLGCVDRTVRRKIKLIECLWKAEAPDGSIGDDNG
jgi:DNA-directed RNA polymerase specialized sigma24 family protein